ncbi:hypothetical protein ALC62_11042 [Cyphomyrmex costatus]|uniref:Uncharacterized protein n=1 Tax=Cyphomyrmex costatus TaxID=456900 RepID=A0A151ICW1_9HYME|nr:hypothetical protein ALC62_11042 [Cyphomyrmex costatus]
MSNVREREKIAREIERTSESIRKKQRALKNGRIDEDIALDRRFKPIVEPLRQIADSSPIVRAIKTESRDATPKRKRMEKKDEDHLPRAMTLNDDAIEYVHWDDPNKLVDRLRLLDASQRAGNTAHGNEMLSIIEELREAGLIIN